MKSIVTLFTALALSLVCSPSLAESPAETAQKLSEPGAGHGAMKALVGTWSVMTTTGMTKKDGKPLTFGGTVVRSLEMGNRFLKEAYDGKGPGGHPYSGVGYLGFDNKGKRYQGVWMTTFNTHMVQYSGTLSEDGKRFVFKGTEADAASEGKPFVMTLEIKSPTEHVLTQEYLNADKSKTASFSTVYKKL